MLIVRSQILLLVAILLALPARSQQPLTSDAEAAADRAYTAKQWAEAEKAYLRLTAEAPTRANLWYRLGVAARAEKQYDISLDAFDKAKTLGANKGLPASLADYEIASTYAAKGDASKAFELLKQSADAGFALASRLDNEEEWSALRTTDSFLALAKQVHHNATPCDDPQFRQLDFWLGDWDVTSAASGLPQGTSHVSREMGGCVVWENWTSAGGPYFGKSYNTYNVALKRWEQYWVDNAAGVIFFHGSLQDNVMDYWTDDVPQTAGGVLRSHLQFIPLGPDKVRQFSRASTDNGKTWQVQYDFIYTRRHPASNNPGF